MKFFSNIIIVLFFLFIQSSCVLFSEPEGTAEIISTYTTNSGDYHYLETVIKITNSSDKNIYTTTINLQAESTKQTYYKTSTSSLVIKPGTNIYITVDFSFEEQENDSKQEENKKDSTEKEEWKKDSVKIIDVFFN